MKMLSLLYDEHIKLQYLIGCAFTNMAAVEARYNNLEEEARDVVSHMVSILERFLRPHNSCLFHYHHYRLEDAVV
jgi:hypothetical protein